MARGDKYICRTCGKIYDYCEKCSVTPIPYKNNGFCSKEHSDIFAILSKHGCNLATAEETLAELGNIENEVFTPSIQAHIDAINAEVATTTVIDTEEVQTTVFEQYDKKKKKW
jgi:hypothetical protein